MNKKNIEDEVLTVLQDIIQEWDVDLTEPLGTATNVVEDLGFASIDMIHLVISLEERFHKSGLGFDQLLMQDGRYVDDVNVAQLTDFLYHKLNGIEA